MTVLSNDKTAISLHLVTFTYQLLETLHMPYNEGMFITLCTYAKQGYALIWLHWFVCVCVYMWPKELPV